MAEVARPLQPFIDPKGRLIIPETGEVIPIRPKSIGESAPGMDFDGRFDPPMDTPPAIASEPAAPPATIGESMPALGEEMPMAPPPADRNAIQSFGDQALPGAVGDFLRSDAALGLSAGILEGGTTGQALGRGFGYALKARGDERALQAEQAATAGKNRATVEFLKSAGADPALITMAENGYGGDALSLYKTQQSSKGNKTEIIMPPGEHTDKLREGLDEAEVDMYKTYLQQGVKAQGILRDMEIIDELVDYAPQGAITGRLANMFPGFSVAGDAFNSVVYKLAPSLRAPGSGSTSDIEYDGFLKAVPNLRNTPDANRLISAVLKKKSEFDVRRRRIILDYQNDDIDIQEARARMAELDNEPLLTPEMEQILKRNYDPGYNRATETKGIPSSLRGGKTAGGVEWSMDGG